MNVNDFVIVKETGEVGVVLLTLKDPSEITVQSRGVIHKGSPFLFERLGGPEVGIINQALETIAKVIDNYIDNEEAYDAVYDEEGKIVYSAVAAAVIRAIAYPSLIAELSKLRGDSLSH